MTEEGLPPKEAARKAMDQITGAVIAMTLVLAAVFIPMALVGGSVGVIYRQFSLTIAISMGISALMALSFTPALCATLLRPVHDPELVPARLQPRSTAGWPRAYLRRVGQAIRHTPRWMVVFFALVVARRLSLCHPAADQLPAGGGPGLCLRHHPVAPGGHHAAHRRRSCRRWRPSSRRTRRWIGC